MSGGHAHVENAIWMRSLLMAGIFLTIGVVAYGVLVGGIAGFGEDQGLNGDYHDAKDTGAQNDGAIISVTHDAGADRDVLRLKAKIIQKTGV